MKKSLLLFTLLVLTNILFAQVRYLDSLFVPIKSQTGGIYGTADAINFPYFDESSTTPQDLLFDVYEPQGDTATARPCIVYAHGGAFIAGSKEDAAVVAFCEAMAAKGYVVLSTQYRLGFNLFNTASAERAVYRGGQDFKAAIRYAKENASGLKIDTTRVFASGNSAGGLSALNAAYFDDPERVGVPSSFGPPDLGCISCSGNTYPHGDEPQAVANMWGAIADTLWIQPNNNVPLIAFHGTNDNTVSADLASPFNNPTFPPIYGSNPISIRMQNLGMLVEYDPFLGAGHEPWGLGDNTYFDTIVTRTAAFLYQHFVQFPTSTQQPKSTITDLTLFPVPTNDVLNVQYDAKATTENIVMIINNLGQRMMQKNIQTQQGFNQYQLNVGNLSAGVYYLVLVEDDKMVTRSFVKN